MSIEGTVVVDESLLTRAPAYKLKFDLIIKEIICNVGLNHKLEKKLSSQCCKRN